MRILVLGLGNEIIADDAAGILAVRRLREDIYGEDGQGECAGSQPRGSSPSGSGSVHIDVVESSAAGMALLEYFVEHERALVIDAVKTGRAPPGTIHELRPEELGTVVAPSAHYAGLPEIMAVAKELRLGFPAEVRILALEVRDPHTIGGPMTESVAAAIPDLVRRARAQIDAWTATR